MPTIHVDGQPYEVPGEKDLLSVLIDLRINLPYFCWHPAMGSVGACRQCAVKTYRDEADQHGKIVMACMTPVSDGLRVSVEDPEVVEFRRRVIEWLMVNHPHDCPVCDEGGECHLQDMTVMTGHVYRRYRGRKRTYRNQNLGPLVNHEMNRCIQCYRCLRFYRDFAGGRDFDAHASKNQVYFGRFEEGPLESEFSGNLIEVCPTGVFNDKTLMRHYTRKWDLETAPSVCVHCGLGCNIIPGARYEMLRRIHARFHPEINRYFICDRGRFGYEFANDERRLRRPRVRGAEQALAWEQALGQAHEALTGCRRVLGIGSPRASLEANWALKALVGDGAFAPGLSVVDHEGLQQALAILREGPARSAALAEVESADAILVLGADPTNEAPMLDYAIRQAARRRQFEIAAELDIPDWNDYPVRLAGQEERKPLYLAAVAGMKLEAIATETLRGAPPELAALGWAVEKAVREKAADASTLAGRIAAALSEAKQPLVVVSAADTGLQQAAAQIARAVSAGREKPCLLFIVAPECNSMGAALLGGRGLEEMLEEIESGRADGLIVLENDLFRRAAPARLERALGRLRYLVALDYLQTRTTAAANLVLPAAPFAETTGTFVNNEGRAQRFYQVFVPQGEQRASWRILGDLIEAQRPGAAPWASCEEVTRAMAHANPALVDALEAAPPASWRDRTGAKVARMTHRSSGRAAETAERTVFEPQPPADPDSPFAFSMEGLLAEPPAALVPRFWYPGWNSVQALNRFEIELGGPLRGGIPGKRLLEPGPGPGAAYQPETQAPLADGEIWLAPRAAIFGSEELSRLAPGIAELTPPPAVRLHPEEAARRLLAEGDLVQLQVEGGDYALSLRLDAGVAEGVAVVPAGYPETAGIIGVCRARIGKAP